jgi:hypothetical protein
MMMMMMATIVLTRVASWMTIVRIVESFSRVIVPIARPSEVVRKFSTVLVFKSVEVVVLTVYIFPTVLVLKFTEVVVLQVEDDKEVAVLKVKEDMKVVVLQVVLKVEEDMVVVVHKVKEDMEVEVLTVVEDLATEIMVVVRFQVKGGLVYDNMIHI